MQDLALKLFQYSQEPPDETGAPYVLGAKHIQTFQSACDLSFALLIIYETAKAGTSFIANQGQPLDGYAELANYRQVIEEHLVEQDHAS